MVFDAQQAEMAHEINFMAPPIQKNSLLIKFDNSFPEGLYKRSVNNKKGETIRYLISFLAVLFLAGYAYGQDDIFGNNYGLLFPMKHDTYGPLIHSDATGRPFKFKTFDGQDVGIFDVKLNAYGPGIGRDEFRRPVSCTSQSVWLLITLKCSFLGTCRLAF